MIQNSRDAQFIETCAKDIEEDKFRGTAKTLLEMIYEFGIKEGRAQVVKNSIDFISK